MVEEINIENLIYEIMGEKVILDIETSITKYHYYINISV